MRLLVISDSHKRGDLVDRIICREKEARHVFFLGDVVSDIEDFVYEYTDRIFHIVSGNCDFFRNFPLRRWWILTVHACFLPTVTPIT
ncbi:MAG: metallophosphoesterase family protein [Clostridia bacterium]|nr:metallophosphoesterase family protein [Clostridia bacterium]